MDDETFALGMQEAIDDIKDGLIEVTEDGFTDLRIEDSE